MRIHVAGHRGMVGSAILEKLQARGAETITRTRSELDLLDAPAVRRFMQAEKPDAVILAAAKVGGIHANNAYPAQFIFENLMIECNVVQSAFEAGVGKLLFLGSSCIYPRDAAQPMAEGALLTGPLELTNEPYAIAKIAIRSGCARRLRRGGDLGLGDAAPRVPSRRRHGRRFAVRARTPAGDLPGSHTPDA